VGPPNTYNIFSKIRKDKPGRLRNVGKNDRIRSFAVRVWQSRDLFVFDSHAGDIVSQARSVAASPIGTPDLQQQNLIQIRATQHGISIVFDPQAPLSDLLSALNTRLQSHAQFYKDADLKLNLGSRVLLPEQLTAVRTTLEEFQLRLSSIICEDQALFERFEQEYGCPVEIIPSDPTHDRHSAGQAASEPSSVYSSSTRAGTDKETIIVRQPCRSGMAFSSQGNMIILGNVNPGAEVRADGDIIIMGELRGNAHAGASGNSSAVIIALMLDPKRLRIADRLAVAPNVDEDPEDSASSNIAPEIAYIVGSQIMIEPFTGRFPTE
jgi:septum site-determining protein MinC